MDKMMDVRIYCLLLLFTFSARIVDAIKCHKCFYCEDEAILKDMGDLWGTVTEECINNPPTSTLVDVTKGTKTTPLDDGDPNKKTDTNQDDSIPTCVSVTGTLDGKKYIRRRFTRVHDGKDLDGFCKDTDGDIKDHKYISRECFCSKQDACNGQRKSLSCHNCFYTKDSNLATILSEKYGGENLEACAKSPPGSTLSKNATVVITGDIQHGPTKSKSPDWIGSILNQLQGKSKGKDGGKREFWADNCETTTGTWEGKKFMWRHGLTVGLIAVGQCLQNDTNDGTVSSRHCICNDEDACNKEAVDWLDDYPPTSTHGTTSSTINLVSQSSFLLIFFGGLYAFVQKLLFVIGQY